MFCSSHARLTIMCAEKEACIQCKSRPREICIQMRRATLAQNPQSQSFPPGVTPPPGFTPQVGFDHSNLGPRTMCQFSCMCRAWGFVCVETKVYTPFYLYSPANLFYSPAKGKGRRRAAPARRRYIAAPAGPCVWLCWSLCCPMI